MDDRWFGLIELILVFAFTMGFGAWQLWSTRRDQRRADAARRSPPASPGEPHPAQPSEDADQITR
jgi:hypothetical protein